MRIRLLILALAALVLLPATAALADHHCVAGTVCLPEAPAVDECVADPAACVEETAEETAEGVEETAGNALPPDAPEDDADPQAPDDRKDGSPVAGSPGAGDEASGPEERPREERSRGGRRDRQQETTDDRDRGSAPPAASTQPRKRPPTPPAAGAVERIVDAVAESSRDLAVPLALMTVAAMFLLVQSRIDRRDPKLTLAPLDSADDLLTFA